MKSLTHAELKTFVKNAKGMLVEDMIQEQSVNIIVGDSGIGKSPLLLQLALCVAAGIPFLGLKTRQCPVLYVDYENSKIDLDEILDSLCEFLGLPSAPDNLRFLHYAENKHIITQEIDHFKPEFILVDALRGLDPKAEKNPETAMACLDWLHRQAEKSKSAFLVLHHTRKSDRKEPPPKLSVLGYSVMDWLQEASGSRSLINQTEARFGIEAYVTGDASLMLRGHFKLRGEVGPWQIQRVTDEYGSPIGYARLLGPSLLSQADRERAAKLPAEFTWQSASESTGLKAGKTLSRLLSACQAAGIIRKVGKGKNTTYSRII